MSTDHDRDVVRQRAAALRRLERRRDNARLLMVIGPLILAIAILGVITGRSIYGPGDVRSTPLFESAVVVTGIVLGTAAVLLGIRQLRRTPDDR